MLAICVGMQLFYEASDEFGEHRGLAFLPGRIARFGAEAPRIPHMGWNRLEVLHEHAFVRDLGPAPYAYFLHSFRAPVDDATLVTCEHGERFAAIVARGSLVATQFHPEKSQATGARLLENCLGIVSGR